MPSLREIWSFVWGHDPMGDEYYNDDEGRYVDSTAHAPRPSHPTKLTQSLDRRRQKKLGLPIDLSSDALIAIAIAMDGVTDKPYSFKEEAAVIDWILMIDELLSECVDKGYADLEIDPGKFDRRLYSYLKSHLNFEPLEFIRLQIYGVVLWLECNRGMSDHEEWISSKLLMFLDTVEQFKPDVALGRPMGVWDPNYNPTGQTGMRRANTTPPVVNPYGISFGPGMNQGDAGNILPPAPPIVPSTPTNPNKRVIHGEDTEMA